MACHAIWPHQRTSHLSKSHEFGVPGAALEISIGVL